MKRLVLSFLYIDFKKFTSLNEYIIGLNDLDYMPFGLPRYLIELLGLKLCAMQMS
jgi:hypothetical protein